MHRTITAWVSAAVIGVVGVQAQAQSTPATAPPGKQTILNVSFDPTRELFDAVNDAFVVYWRSRTGHAPEVRQSHGGSGKQARSVIDGLEADVVTLALAYDIDVLHDKAGLVPADWRDKLPERSVPFSSTIVLLVRKGNPKAIKDWDDLARPGVGVVSPNPKTSGGARWNYLAVWGYALRKRENDAAKAQAFVGAVFANVAVYDTGARGATNTFVQRGVGDVLVGWESDALLVRREFAREEFEIIYPSVSIKAEPPVAVVEKVAAKRGTTELARGYLEFLYTDSAQEIIASQFFRPSSTAVAQKHSERFRTIPLFTVDEVFGGWRAAQKTHFDDGGTFDQIQKLKK